MIQLCITGKKMLVMVLKNETVNHFETGHMTCQPAWGITPGVEMYGRFEQWHHCWNKFIDS